MGAVHPDRVRVDGRLFQALLIVAGIGLSWLAMMVVHESGHVMAALVTGGKVKAVDLHPLRFSSTGVWPNPHPLRVVWGGPVWGCVLPAGVYAVVRWRRWRWAYLARFFAGFCLVANGAYLACGWVDRVGDAGDLLRYGTPVWVLVAVRLPAVALGLVAWHGLGPAFGLGPARGQVDRRAALAVTVTLVVLIVAELLAGPWLAPGV